MASPKVVLESITEKVLKTAKAKLPDFVTDEDGKVYKLRIPSELDKFDLNIALGSQHSANLGLLMQATPLIWIESIDGISFDFAGTLAGLRVAIKNLGRNGMRVVSDAVQNFLIAENGDAEESIENVKKS